jgi:hypothetical protein
MSMTPNVRSTFETVVTVKDAPSRAMKPFGMIYGSRDGRTVVPSGTLKSSRREFPSCSRE